MALTVILVLIGLVLGQAIWEGAGWLPGALLGLLSGQLIGMAERLKTLERELARRPMAETEPTGQPARPADSGQAPVTPRPVREAPAPRPPAAVATAARVASASTAESKSTGNGDALGSPTLFDRIIRQIGRFFTEGNPIVRAGIVVLFFGLSFLVKYASRRVVFPLELRLSLVAAVSMALVVIGWRTRNRQNGYGLVLQGGGIAALYLTVFAATKVFPLLSSTLAFALMFIIVLVGAALAILQNAQVLALTATAGGFLAPILTSDGSGNHVALFTFYLLLNVGVLTIAWFKAWRMLNWVGFVFTFVISSIWGVLSYEPHLYYSTQPFLLAFFALYLTVAVLFSLRQPPKLTGLVDGSLVFGLPIAGFGLQAALLQHTEYGLAISAIVLATTYMGLARWLWARHCESHRLMTESFLALGAGFATLAIPLALDAAWTSATWALEAAGLVWVGARQARLLPRAAGYLLYVAAVVAFFASDGFGPGNIPIISASFIGTVILAVAALGMAWTLHAARTGLPRLEKVEGPAIVVGIFWWLYAGCVELVQHLGDERHYAATMIFAAASLFGFARLGLRLMWPLLVRSGYAIVPVVACWVLPNLLWWLFAYDMHPLDPLGALAVGIFAALNYSFLWLRRNSPRALLHNVWHFLSAMLILVHLWWEALWWQQELNLSTTASQVLGLICFALPLTLFMILNKKPHWPFVQNRLAYRDLIPLPLLGLSAVLFIAASSHGGGTERMHLPLLNPLDLAQLAVVLVLAFSIRNGLAGLGTAGPELRIGLPALAAFLWVNVVLLRAVHHYAGVSYSPGALWDSPLAQMGLSILWTFCALLLTKLAQHRQQRALWIAGAVLLGLVLLKLFTRDLTGTGTLARVVSFMGAGALMLLIGYLSPMPAKRELSATELAEEGAR
ncbi:DUF2339 domain-containing protein [Gilvimarinus sp. F26214L]|uniref:DUF2339 domain-containing protein n=1 Tax=Gilvimarinus sp. DZF01 TaxID=3461371 RepID=UPI0040458BFA